MLEDLSTRGLMNGYTPIEEITTITADNGWYDFNRVDQDYDFDEYGVELARERVREYIEENSPLMWNVFLGTKRERKVY